MIRGLNMFKKVVIISEVIIFLSSMFLSFDIANAKVIEYSLEDKIWNSQAIHFVSIIEENVITEHSHKEYRASIEEVFKGDFKEEEAVIVSKGDGIHQPHYQVGKRYITFLRAEEGVTNKFTTVNAFYGNLLVENGFVYQGLSGKEALEYDAFIESLLSLIKEQEYICTTLHLTENGFRKRYINLIPNSDLIIHKSLILLQEYRLIGPEGYSGGRPFEQLPNQQTIQIDKKYFNNAGEYTLFAGDDIYNTPENRTARIKVME